MENIMKSYHKEDIVSHYTSPDEETEILALIKRIKAGDEESFTIIVKRYRQQVASVAYRIVGDYDDAADVAQMVFLKASQNLSKFDESRRFYTWLYKITVNASIDYLRKHRRHKHEELDIAVSVIGQDRDNPEQSFRTDKLGEYIKAATERLNGRQKEAFVLRDLEGCQIDDVAEIMDMPEATVRWYLHRARLRIRKDLRWRCPHLLQAIGII